MGHTAVSVSKTSSVTLYNWPIEPEKITVICNFYKTVDTMTGSIRTDSEYLKFV